jgi:hypothetical protein
VDILDHAGAIDEQPLLSRRSGSTLRRARAGRFGAADRVAGVVDREALKRGRGVEVASLESAVPPAAVIAAPSRRRRPTSSDRSGTGSSRYAIERSTSSGMCFTGETITTRLPRSRQSA